MKCSVQRREKRLKEKIIFASLVSEDLGSELLGIGSRKVFLRMLVPACRLSIEKLLLLFCLDWTSTLAADEPRITVLIDQ